MKTILMTHAEMKAEMARQGRRYPDEMTSAEATVAAEEVERIRERRMRELGESSYEAASLGDIPEDEPGYKPPIELDAEEEAYVRGVLGTIAARYDDVELIPEAKRLYNRLLAREVQS